MKIAQINITCGSGSTGKICVAISELLTKQGIENYIFYSSGYNGYPLGYRYMKKFELKLQALKSRVLGNYGFNSGAATKRLLNHLSEIQPDVICLHNLHGHNVHLGMLFSYIKEKNIKVFWTFHDCWAFTAYCPYYDMAGCAQWKNGGCKECPQIKNFSWFFDRSSWLFEQKKELFRGIDLTIITPSKWLAEQVKQSFLRDYDIKVINNGIDLSVFKPTDGDFRDKHNLNGKFMVLGVAFGWGKRKGLDVFVRLANRLDPEKFQIVLVGTDKNIDKQLPENIISIHRTANQRELAEIYTAADLFVNPTREENFPTVNLESLACGTPVLTYRTGGSPECIDETSGVVVDCDDEITLLQEILKIERKRPYDVVSCANAAQRFAADLKFDEHLSLYGVGG